MQSKRSTVSTSAACAVCGSQKLKLLWPVKSNVDGALTGDYWIYRCQECGAGMTFPVPGPEVLAKHYQVGVYQKSGGRASLLIDAFLTAMHDQRLREIICLRRPPGKLLDVGCGKGRFVARAATHGWNAQGVEPSSSQVAAARARYSAKVFEGELQQAMFADSSFDVVTAWHVVEHVPDSHVLVTEVQRILRPGGLFVCEVPNFASWQAQLGGDRWFHLDVPRHLVHYTTRALEQLLIQHDLQVVSQHTFSLESGPVGMLESMLNRIGLPPNWMFRWIKRSVHSCDLGMLALNTVAVALAAGPALFLEVVASLVAQSGGVVRVMAVSR